MRGVGVIIVAAAFATSAAAQGPAPAGAPAAPDVVRHLQAWQQVMAGTTNFYSVVTLQRAHLILKNRSTAHAGRVDCMKGANNTVLARLHIDRLGPNGQPVPGEFMRYVCNGRAVYQYDGATKEVTEYLLPNGGVGNNLLLEFISGTMTAAAIQKRFDVSLLKEDANYVYLTIKPRFPADKQEFETLTLALYAPGTPKAYLPRTVVMKNPNGQEQEQWDFDDAKAPGQDPRVNVPNMTADLFTPPQPPAGWKVIEDPKRRGAQQPPAPGGAAPRVARPAGQ